MGIPEDKVQNVARLRASASERIDFESLISDLSARFIGATHGKVDEEIERALAQLREFFHMDRWGLIEVAPAGNAHVTHASYAEGMSQASKIADLRELFPWSYNEIVKRGNCLISCKLEDLPNEAEKDRRSFAAWGIKSSLHIPLFHGGRVAFIFACNSMRGERVWPEEFLPRLRLLGEIFVNALVRTRAEEARRLSDARYRSLVEAQSDPIARSDLSGRLTFVNDAYCQAFGRSREELLGTVFTLNVLPEDLPVSRGVVDEIQLPPFRKQTETRHSTPAGIRWINWDNSAVLDEHGCIVELQSVGRDITSRKEMESELKARLQEIEDLKRQLEAENVYLREETKTLVMDGPLVGNSPALRTLMAQVQQVASTDSTVLLLGETGTGKGLVARCIHDLSRRKHRIMVRVDCASLPPSLIESELFGREKGAYTGALTSQIGRFESANGSTIFLDEIAELTLELQAKLLRVVQEGEFERLGSPKTVRIDARVIAATNRNLLQEMQEGRFREDLYYRLGVFPIRVPALRERAEDIPFLVQAFVSEFSARMGKKIRPIPRRDMDSLQRHHWPGNVRELRNVIERAFIISEGEVLNIRFPRGEQETIPTAATLREADASHILRSLEACQWRIKGPDGAARLLGLKPSTLYNKMNKLGIPTRRTKDQMRT